MKKNKMMRIASVLLVAVLISTCAIAGTYAKYVTRASGEDTARVAKWGILIDIDGGDMFASKYPASDKLYLAAEGKYSVEAFAEEGKEADKVVAPGTSSDEIEKTLTATVTGKPEVAARYAITGTVNDIVLPAGKYIDYTNLVLKDGEYGYTDTFTLDKDYAPVKWNLLIKKGNTEFDVATELYKALPENLMAAAEAYGMSKEGCSFFAAVNILKKVAGNDGYKEIVEAALGNIVSGGRNFQLDVTDDGVFTLSYDFDANKEMGFEFTLSWAWAFEQLDDNGNVIDLYDMADTYLGNLAAGIDGIVVPEGANLTIGATLTASATQID